MALILSLETSTKVCSVCLSKGEEIIAKKELYEANSHATHLTVFIQELFENLDNYTIKDIDAVAVSSGPGSYTGLRIGVSVAKGICYALNKPLIAITSLEALAHAAFDNDNISKETLICPMIDARRMEVYTTLFNADMQMVKKISAKIIDENSFAEELATQPILFLGDGAGKCMDIIQSDNATYLKDKAPLAANMVKTANTKFNNKEFENVAYFEPFYLKDFVATTPKKKVL